VEGQPNASKGRLSVRIEKTGERLSVKPENLHKIWLRGSGAGAMPPLQYVGSKAPGLEEGDLVLLHDLKMSSLNGEKAKVTKTAVAEEERIQVALLRTGQKLMVSQENVQRTGSRPETSRAAGSSAATPQDILEQLKFAMQSSDLAEIDQALGSAEASQGLEWGDLLAKKKQLLKKLRARRKKFCDDADDQKACPPADTSSRSKTVVRQWCEELQLPVDLVEKLAAEEVTDPQELTGVPDEELASLVVGWKMGPKGRFMKAVQRMKAAERAELGSTTGSTC